MFIGHFALALGAKRAAPRASLGVLMAACQLPDLLWPVFLLLGWERVAISPGDTAFTRLAFTHYPLSHSLAAVLAWAALAGAAYGVWTRDRAGAAAVSGLVLSHWVLDWVTHRPDLPLFPGGPVAGLGLWNSVPATLLTESLLFAAGLAVYLRATRPRNGAGRWALASLIGLLLFIYVGDRAGQAPPSWQMVAYAALGLWLVPAWAAWADRNREPSTARAAPAAASHAALA